MRIEIPSINASTSIARYRWVYRILYVARTEECTGAWSICSAPRNADEKFNSHITDSAPIRTQLDLSLIDAIDDGAPSNANASSTIKVTSATRRSTFEMYQLNVLVVFAPDHCIKCTRIFFYYKKITNIIFSFLREAYLLCSTY